MIRDNLRSTLQKVIKFNTGLNALRQRPRYNPFMTTYAAIDIGSNAVRLAIAELQPDGGPVHVSFVTREPVRLGTDVFKNGIIGPDTYNSLKAALIKFGNQMENHQVIKHRAVATSALREAKNGADIVKKLKKDTGILVELISGEEEARLVYEAISQKVSLLKDRHLLIDIGGGSIELVAVERGKLLKKESFPLGAVRVLGKHNHQKEPLEDWLPDHIDAELSSFFKGLEEFDYCVGTGGNMDRFIKLKDVVSDEPGEHLTRKELMALKEKIQSLNFEDRIQKLSLRRDRADVIVPAAITTVKIMKMAGAHTIKLPQVGLRDGLLSQLCSSSKDRT